MASCEELVIAYEVSMSLTVTSPQNETYHLPFALRDIEYTIVDRTGFTGVIIKSGRFMGKKLQHLTMREKRKIENCFVLSLTGRKLKFAFEI